MAERDEILAFADELLELEAYPDYGPMGMQVAGTHEVERITCGVSASLELFERAVGAGAQLLLVHHGLLWDNDPRVIDDAMRRRLKALLDSGARRDLRDDRGKTALDIARETKHDDTARVLTDTK